MKASEWKAFLATWTSELATRETGNRNERRTLDPVHGLARPGATDDQIRAAEARLGAILPPSYREFLKASNGLLQPFSYVAACGGDLLQVEEIDWFAVRNSDWIAAYEGVDDAPGKTGADRFVEELSGTLEISHDGDGAVYLLNPRVTAPSGDWEAWFFATWSPEVERFRSFAEMMRMRYRQFSEGITNGF